MKIQITTSTFGRAGEKPIKYLENLNIEYNLNPYGRTLSENEAIELLKNADGVIAGTEPLTKRVLEQIVKLKVISRCGTGLNNVDLAAAKNLGIKVRNTPDIHVDAVAELALAGLLCIMRNLSFADSCIRKGNWGKKMGRSLYNKKIGIIGYGKVGKRFIDLLEPFTQNIYYYDPFVQGNSNLTAQKVENLPVLFSTCDVVSIHIPYSADNHHIIDRNLLATLKNDAILINTSRGGLIDENALYLFLKENPNASAYLDVYEKEPYEGKLSGLENILLTSHLGTTTKETREEMEYQACVNLINAMHE